MSIFNPFFLISSSSFPKKKVQIIFPDNFSEFHYACYKCPLEDQETWFGLFCSIIISIANFIPHCPLK